MDNKGKEIRDLETLAWGMLLLWCGMWWGILEPGEVMPAGMGALGVGLILLGVNTVRLLKDIPIYLFSTVTGILFLMVGGLRLARLFLHLPPFELPLCGIFLIILGATLLARELMQTRKTGLNT